MPNSKQQTANSKQQTANSKQQTANSIANNLNDVNTQSFLNELDQSLWKAADTLRKNLDAANYKHIVLGFIFLKYISDTFTDFQGKLKANITTPESDIYLDPSLFEPNEFEQILSAELEERDYYTTENIFWVPTQARWDNLKEASKLNIGDNLPWGGTFKGVSRLIDDARTGGRGATD